ncbi:MAG: UDP-N-acetylglucosamine 1-carboxyvinyltransferase [Bacillota bacterium]|jgi:UDP-N-acetylglucosamine 1-carboxyvinyltransferase|nr:UDP-N-acetylglucosamine 1-carboxyvinyltransferase [Bacillota bacterium]
MEKIIRIRRSGPLKGSVGISGAKNAAVAIIPATLLAQGTCILENVPPLTDVHTQCDILSALGAKVQWLDATTIKIDPSQAVNGTPPEGLAAKLRASYYFMGALLGRFGSARTGMPGGCKIGPRPIDQHLKGFQALGYDWNVKDGEVILQPGSNDREDIYFDLVSVGATINVMLAAAGLKETTTIENAAREPEIIDVANFLNKIGVTVRGAGTGTLRISGDARRGATAHSIIPDRIEAGTFMVAAAATGGDVTVKDIIPRHLEAVTAKLRETGVTVVEGDDWIQVQGPVRGTAIDVKTFPYPGFPTDLQQPLASYLAICSGTSIITENIFEGRFRYVDELKRMGANIKVAGRAAVIEGVEELLGATVRPYDLRASSALVIAGLVAQGETRVRGVKHLRRGYYDFIGKLKGLGADIELI